MDHTVTLIAVFAIFIPALILPGPDFAGIVRVSLLQGPREAIATAFGISLMQAFYASLSILGLAALLAQYHWLAVAVRVAGGIYLAWLGLRLIFNRDSRAEAPEPASRSIRGAFLFGIFVTLTNPKAVVLFASIFATAVTPATPGWLMAVMVALVFGSCFLWYTCVALFFTSAAFQARLKAGRKVVERIVGACLVGFGIKLVSDARSPVTT